MILNPKDQITTPQTAVIIINFILGTGLLTLPRSSTEKVHTPDVWISVIIGGIITIIAGVIMVKLSQQFPDKTFYQYINEIVGKWVGSFLSLVIICYFLMTSGFQLRSMAEVIRYLLLEGTPTWAIIMIFMWVGLYLIIGGINPIARLFEIILPLTVILFLVVTLMSIKIFEIDNLRPVLGDGVIPVLKGVKTTALAFSGPEIMLLLIPFMNQPKKAVKALLVGVSIPLIFYVITVVMVIGALSVDGVVTRTWPTLDLIRSFEISGLIFERFESLLLVVWIMQIFATFTITYFAAALGLAQLTKKSIHPFMFGLLPILYIIAMIPKNMNDLFKQGDFVGNIALFLFGLLPLLLLIISRIKGGKYETTT
ncbi:spore gernimation protein [Bacillus sp. Soil745]|uniref:spore germination protein n=1 Tax=Peribacillus frigoritolerans TaxID=450367 RepID=UPI00070A8DEF|nr:spore germination protein [Peribacillus frigoritolerans]KRF59405.1 spore gernimation protein [Bacillus sp. Soil745]MED3711328.1 spore germination protein [Peribacillus frigoritolerans]MED3889895.1 spore germination protein [Peribacillus frigoritolerans]PAW27288.1 spore gernimation protein [Peribacillus simplex]